MNQPLSEYLSHKQKQETASFKIKNGDGIYFPDTPNPIPKKDYEKTCPIGAKVTLWNNLHKGDNPDKTHVK